MGITQLNDLINEALAGNPGLRIAEARTRSALAQVAAADSARGPECWLQRSGRARAILRARLVPATVCGQLGHAGTVDRYLVVAVGFLG